MSLSQTDPTAPDADEKALLARLRAGENAAFEQLIRVYGGRLLAVARRFLPVEEDARDAVQEAFLNAFRSLDRFEGGSRVSTWLHRIAVNAALMKLRSKRRKPERSIEEFLPTYLDDGHHVDRPQPWAESGETGAIRAETRVPGLTAEEYLYESIVDPDAYVVDGFRAGQMLPIYEDRLSPDQIDALVTYLLTLTDEERP